MNIENSLIAGIVAVFVIWLSNRDWASLPFWEMKTEYPEI